MTILSIIIKSYFQIVLAIGGAAILIFALGTYLIFRLNRSRLKPASVPKAAKPNTSKTPRKSETTTSSSDINAIAGDDPVSTQLDLARAYIDSGKNQLAKIILESVAETGSNEHQEEAQRLLSSI